MQRARKSTINIKESSIELLTVLVLGHAAKTYTNNPTPRANPKALMHCPESTKLLSARSHPTSSVSLIFIMAATTKKITIIKASTLE